MRTLRFLAIPLMVSVVLALLASGCNRAATQQYPSKPIDLVVHTAPGAAADTFMRMVADILEKEKLSSQPFNIINKPGGNGGVSLSYVHEKKGDPYTVANMQNVHLVTMLSGKAGDISYKAFTPISLVMFDPNLIIVRADSKYKTVRDLVEDSKTQPKGLSVGFGSMGSADHIIAFKIAQLTGAKFNYLSFTGGGTEATTQVLGGHIDISGGQPAEVSELVKAGKVRILATASEKRLPILPDVPTLAEQGIPVVFKQFRGFMGPPEMPQDAVRYMEAAFKKMTQTKRWKDYTSGEGVGDDVYMNGADFSKFLGEWAGELEPIIKAMDLNKK